MPAHLRPLLGSTVRGLVRGVPVYIVPRLDGTVVIGATQREDALAAPDAAGAVSAGGVYQLLRDAQQLLPAVAELELLEAPRGHGPGPRTTPRCWAACADRAPGRDGDVGGLIIATGFFRHGILLTPAAADLPAVAGGHGGPALGPFPARPVHRRQPPPAPHHPRPLPEHSKETA